MDTNIGASTGNASADNTVAAAVPNSSNGAQEGGGEDPSNAGDNASSTNTVETVEFTYDCGNLELINNYHPTEGSMEVSQLMKNCLQAMAKLKRKRKGESSNCDSSSSGSDFNPLEDLNEILRMEMASRSAAAAVPEQSVAAPEQSMAVPELSMAAPEQSITSSLHQRRKTGSPEKFDKGKFEPQTLRIPAVRKADEETDVEAELTPASKKAKVSQTVYIAYDSLGTPTLRTSNGEAFTPKSLGGDKQEEEQEEEQEEANVDNSVMSDDSSDISSLSTTSSSACTYLPEDKFNLLASICRDEAVLLNLVSFLPVPSLVNLYIIYPPFHYLLNRHATGFIMASVRTWAPGAERLFPWRYYKDLCIKDPVLRIKHRFEGRTEEEIRAQETGTRDVPSLRWLQMVVWRQNVCLDILIRMAVRGLLCPPGTLDAIQVSFAATTGLLKRKLTSPPCSACGFCSSSRSTSTASA